MTLRIVADENMPNVENWFSTIASSIVRKPGRTLTKDDLAEADVLLVRSVTQVNEALLQNTPVKFVGSATIGTDHIDQAYLSSQNIQFHHAPGCNAQSVVDWLLAVLARMHVDHDLHWWQKTIGVVGVGNVGSKVVARLKAIGCRVLECDPIRHENGLLDAHVELADLMQQCDIVCLHTPHTRAGNYPTHQMINHAMLEKMRPNALLINGGRGPVVEHQALLSHLEQNSMRAVLDVWPDEPEVPESLLNRVDIASPHVAGYSLEGKYMGTQMLAQAAYDWAKLTVPSHGSLPQAFNLDARLYQQEDADLWVSELILAVYDPARDTVAMRQSVESGYISSSTFDQLRKSYPIRRELASITLTHVPAERVLRLSQFGFRCV